MKTDANDDDYFDAEAFLRDLIADDEPEVVAETTISPKTVGSNDEDFDAAAFFEEAIGDDEPDVATPTIIGPKPWPKPRNRVRPPINNIPDALTSGFFEPAIAELEAAFDLWKTNSARTRQSLWDLLGNIYELSAKLMGNENARSGLIGLVSRREDVKSSTNWRSPGTKHPRELLLVLLLGLSEDSKATKSQWLSALKAAEAAGIEKSKSDFVDWISSVGGIEGARSSIAKPRPTASLQELAAQVDEFVSEESRIVYLPAALNEDPLPSRFGLVLVREAGSENTAFQVATINDERLVLAALKAFLSGEKRIANQIEKHNLAIVSAIEAEKTKKLRAEKKKAWKEWRKQVKVWRCRDTFEEYFDRWLYERSDLGLYDDWANERITL
jgi:hypothetical protein